MNKSTISRKLPVFRPWPYVYTHCISVYPYPKSHFPDGGCLGGKQNNFCKCFYNLMATGVCSLPGVYAHFSHLFNILGTATGSCTRAYRGGNALHGSSLLCQGSAPLSRKFNSTVTSSTRVSSHMLTYGREPPCPIDAWCKVLKGEEVNSHSEHLELLNANRQSSKRLQEITRIETSKQLERGTIRTGLSRK